MTLGLTRKTNEAIVIDDRIQLAVLSIRSGRVRLGVEAPRDDNQTLGEF